MTTTDTERETRDELLRWCCSVCGTGPLSTHDPGPYAHNTCSQRCACTAAIVGALGQLTTAFSDWRTELRQAVIDPQRLRDATPTVTTPPTW
jgi:hypothetical protein